MLWLLPPADRRVSSPPKCKHVPSFVFLSCKRVDWRSPTVDVTRASTRLPSLLCPCAFPRPFCWFFFGAALLHVKRQKGGGLTLHRAGV